MYKQNVFFNNSEFDQWCCQLTKVPTKQPVNGGQGVMTNPYGQPSIQSMPNGQSNGQPRFGQMVKATLLNPCKWPT